jgi:hypothetical protein
MALMPRMRRVVVLAAVHWLGVVCSVHRRFPVAADGWSMGMIRGDMGSGVKDGDGPASLSRGYRVSRISQAAWPLHLRRSFVIKRPLRQQLRRRHLFSPLRSLLARLFIFSPRPAFSRPMLPETPMPAEPLIRVLETFDLSREEEKEYT